MTGLILFLILTPLATNADYQSGLDAYNSSDFTTALHDWKAAASTPPGSTAPNAAPNAAPDAAPDTSSAAYRAIYAETHYAIGMLYWLGQGVAKDYFTASNWMHKAAELNHAGAQAKLGYLYTEGIAVAKDYHRAFKWFSKAAQQGDMDGQYNLGIFYLNGWGTEQNTTLAAQYLAAASAQGDQAAEETLQQVLAMVPPPDAPPDAPPRHSGIAQHPPPRLKKDWILSQNPEHFAIQVIALRSLDKLLSLIEAYDYLAPFATYTVELKGKPLYVLVQGNYLDVDSARHARDNFPRAINRPSRVWVRQFRRIQEIIREAGQGAHE